MSNLINFTDVIQAPFEQLALWQTSASFENDEVREYANVIYLYLKGDTAKLMEVAQKLEGKQPKSFLSLISQIRSAIRMRKVSVELLDSILKQAQELESFKLLEGEFLFCAGYASTTIDRHDLAAQYYERAIGRLMLIGAKKKALKAALNRLAAISTTDADQNLVADYQSVYREAKRSKDLVTAGLCVMNISREYQRLGALKAALFFARRSIVYMQQDSGTVHFALAQVHLAHVLYQSEQIEEADLYYDLAASSANFPEVKAALDILFSLRNRAASELQIVGANASWNERRLNAESEMSSELFSEMENKLLQLLRSGSRTKVDLIENLYGTAADYESLENRLKNLLFRIRKRSPELVRFDGSQYVLSKIDVMIKRT